MADDDTGGFTLVSRPKQPGTDMDDTGGFTLVSRPKKPDQPAGQGGAQEEAVRPAPGGGYMNNYRSEYDASRQEMSEGASRATTPGASLWERVKGAGEAAMGAGRYAWSPVEAATRTAADPVEVGLRKAGAPEWLSKGAGDTVDIAGQMLTPGAAKKGLEAIKEIPAAARELMPMINKGASAVGGTARSAINTADDIVKHRLEMAHRAQMEKAANAAPSRTQLRDAASDAFAEADKAGVKVTPQAFTDFTANLPKVMQAEKITSGTIPMSDKIYEQTKNLVDRLDQTYQGHELTLANLQILQQEANGFVKKALRAAEGDRGDQDVRGATIVAKQIKDFVQNLKPEQLASGDPQKAIPALNKAKELWRRNAKMDTVENIIDVAKDLKDPDYIQQQFREIVKDRNTLKEFSPREQKLITDIAAESGVRDAVEAIPGGRKAAKVVDFARGTNTARMKKAKELMDMIARGEAAQAVPEGPSFMDQINQVLRPGPPNSANRRFN